jgi:hypothetical protein
MERKDPNVSNQAKAMNPSPTEPVLNAKVQAQLGRRLRVMFEGQIEPVPDRFQHLLAQIDEQLRAQK